MSMRGLPAWATATIASLATLVLVLAASLVLVLHARTPSRPTSFAAKAGPTVTPTSPSPVTVTTTVTASPTTEVSLAPRATVHPVVRPRGSAHVLLGGNYGQGISYADSCATWHVRVENESNLEVTGLAYRAASAEFDNSDFQSKPALRPPLVNLHLSVPAHSGQDVDFRSCTTSHSPPGYDDYEESSPNKVLLTYRYGFRQTVCFGRPC